MADFESLSQSVISGKATQVKEKVTAMLEAGVNPLDIINEGLIGGMNVVGPRFKSGEMFVPEVLMSAKAMAAGIEIIKPLIADQDIPSAGKVVIGTVKGDLHDIGKNLVAMMIESGGYSVVDVGVDISPEKFIEAVREHKPSIIGMSALLTTTMLNMKDTIDLLKEEGLRDQVKVMVGGAPVSKDFANEIGADGFAPDAASAVELCKKFLA
ncbi:methyltransferase cognate corrinoid protein [Desulfosporosinus orientis DSM 765]|uniref:Methyltransferase cognate corrinoid protein n=1 Tax=Desulfosporosinus orientis (strain ATCC 19365 / DSM 765 / NCIMB 8382 / VKM B-1628 / Singapore I) TaxID=768706 RepID=G7W6X6_DESOD|nr:corrinoid protein [Desulfosporosinus orientis]AET69833.1 methyltransferase cognate corrinoid protein [Desulfosporosinus orientis DSM 765]